MRKAVFLKYLAKPATNRLVFCRRVGLRKFIRIIHHIKRIGYQVLRATAAGLISLAINDSMSNVAYRLRRMIVAAGDKLHSQLSIRNHTTWWWRLFDKLWIELKVRQNWKQTNEFCGLPILDLLSFQCTDWDGSIGGLMLLHNLGEDAGIAILPGSVGKELELIQTISWFTLLDCFAVRASIGDEDLRISIYF